MWSLLFLLSTPLLFLNERNLVEGISFTPKRDSSSASLLDADTYQLEVPFQSGGTKALHQVRSEADGSFKGPIQPLKVAGDVYYSPKDGEFLISAWDFANPPVKSGNVPVASALFTDSGNSTGWGYVRVRISNETSEIPDSGKMYAAGLIEGFLTANRIHDFHLNTHDILSRSDKEQSDSSFSGMYEGGVRYILVGANVGTGLQQNCLSRSGGPIFMTSSFAHLCQSIGMRDGYNARAPSMAVDLLTGMDFFLMNVDGETPELLSFFSSMERVALAKIRAQSTKHAKMPHDAKLRSNPSFIQTEESLAPSTPQQWTSFLEKHGRCSSLVRRTTNDLFVGHTTWEDYSEMSRVFKYYDFPLESHFSTLIGFSSYPGVISSTDDFYMTNTGLVVTETTLPVYSKKQEPNIAHVVFDFVRIMVSTRLAENGTHWASLMEEAPGGISDTYNAAWFVVDYSRFNKETNLLEDGCVIKMEQGPGAFVVEDVTEKVRKEGYVSSHNRASIPAVREATGESAALQRELQSQHSDFMKALYDPVKNPRARLFAELAPKVHNLEGMRSTMQANPNPNPASPEEAEYAVSARFDLQSENPSPSGGTDSKITNSLLMEGVSAAITCGPETEGGHPPFRFKDGEGRDMFPNIKHVGLPDEFNFPWYKASPNEDEMAPL